MGVVYLHLPPEGSLPNFDYSSPFKAIVVAATAVSGEWQGRVSKWLVESGCLYMMAWGVDASSWDDSVDHANLEAFDYREIPDRSFVTTTWHDDAPFREVCWFADALASHPTETLETIIIVDINKQPRGPTLLADFAVATNQDGA